MTTKLVLDDFPVRTNDKIRYGDTDRQGHVNNAVFSTFLELARVEILYDEHQPLVEEGRSFVIARLSIDFLAELLWPGVVEIGSHIIHAGRSSATFEQAIFQNGICAASAQTVVVQIDQGTRRSTPFSPTILARLEAMMQPRS